MARSPVPICRASPLPLYARAAEQAGAPVQELLYRHKLPTEAQNCPTESWVPYVSLRRFLDDAARSAGVDDLGWETFRMQTAENGPSIIAPSLARQVLCAPTLFAGLSKVSGGIFLQSSHLHVWLELAGPTVRLCHANSIGPEVAGYDVVDSFSTWSLIALIRKLLGQPRWLPRRVLLREVDGRRGQHTFQSCGTDVSTLANHAAIEFSKELLWARLPGCECDLRPSEPPNLCGCPAQLDDALRSCLASLVIDGRPSLEVAAEITGMSVRTMQRQLKNEGTNFTQVLEGARLDVAKALLEKTDMSLVEIALRVGYSEQSAFTRAFRNWTGMAPSAFRRRLHSRLAA